MSVEQVTKYHPDKACDIISDTLLTEYLSKDPNSRCAIETMWKGDTVIVAGEVTSKAEGIFPVTTVRNVAKDLGYKADRVIDLLAHQSPEISKAVNKEVLVNGTVKTIGAGDQGMMWGYATRETESLLPYGFDLANHIVSVLEDHVRDGVIQGDAKVMVSYSPEWRNVSGVRQVLISACQREHINRVELFGWLKELFADEPFVMEDKLVVNPGGEWKHGGPSVDCGLTGRKIVCDQYGGGYPVGGGAFSGKDPTKVDRSGAYMARRIACDLLHDEELDTCKVQLSYEIGVPEPVGVSVYADGCLSQRMSMNVKLNYDLTPRGIIDFLHLDKIDYGKLASGCHYRDRMFLG